MYSLYLTRRPPWNFRYDQELVRYLEGTQPFRCKSADLVDAAPRSLQDNRGGDIFAKQGMRYRECGRVLNVGMAAKHLVDLQRSYLFASAVDHFLQAPRKKQISVAVEISLIPGSIPFAEKRIHVFIRIHFIAAEHAGAPHRDFSVLAGG